MTIESLRFVLLLSLITAIFWVATGAAVTPSLEAISSGSLCIHNPPR